MARRRQLCLYLPHLPTDRVRRDHCLPASRPLVLTRSSGGSVAVECADALALQRGLRPGMSLAQAQALVPELLARPFQPQQDRRALRRLADWAVRFSPLVATGDSLWRVEPQEPDALLLDITGCERLFRGEANLAQQALDGLVEQGFSAHAAVADTVGAAWAVASTAARRLIIVPPGQTRDYLAPLPVAALRLGSAVSSRLEAVGLRTIGELLKLPRAALPARFGPQLILRLQQALGEVFEGVAVHQPAPSPQARLTCPAAIHDTVRLAAVVDRLLDRVLADLERRGRAARRLECVLVREVAAPTEFSVSLVHPSRDGAHIGRLIRSRLETLDLAIGVSGIKITASQTAPWPPRQAELFDSASPRQDEQFGELLDRLAARLGDEAVVRPELVDDHQPERAFVYRPVSEAGISAAEDIGEKPRTHLAAGLRPMRLLARPVPVRALALVPDGPPAWFSYHGRDHLVVASAGPERLETGWWRGSDQRRDYFRVTTDSGEQFWLFYDLNGGRWYLHGIFA